jgi:hypothetical protein
MGAAALLKTGGRRLQERDKYRHNGGTAFHPPLRRRSDGDHGSFVRSLDEGFAGEGLGVRDSCLWGSNGLDWLPDREKHCHNGGMAFAFDCGGGYQIARG